MTELTTYGAIKAGRLSWQNPERLRDTFATFPEGPVEIVIRCARRKHSDPQRGYYWAVVIPIITNAINEQQGEEAFSRDDVHQYLRQLHNTKVTIHPDTLQEVKIPASTSNLTTVGFSEYTERCKDWAAQMLSVFIPDPDPSLGKRARMPRPTRQTSHL